MSERVMTIITGGFSGLIVGWIWGHAFADDPSTWAFAAGICTVAGLIAGFNTSIREQAGSYLGAVAGLYLGWVIKTLLFGDQPGGWGTLIMVMGMMGGADRGAEAASRNPRLTEAVLLNMVYAGFLGGFFIDFVILDAFLGWRTDHSILAQAPILLTAGVLGGLAALISFGREGRQSADPE